MKKIYYIDAGHGAILDGKYLTAPRKMHKHPDGSIAYEGVINRRIGSMLHTKIRNAGFQSIYVDTPLDINLNARVNAINALYAKYKNLVVLSLHSNASPSHNARGNEIITSFGETKSDKFATIFGEQYVIDLPDVKFRPGFFDPNEEVKDLDKEMDLCITRESNCPAVLFENLFFDQYEDWQLLQSNTYINDLTNSKLQAIKQIELSTL